MQTITVGKAVFNVRPDSWDNKVVNAVATGNEYGLFGKNGQNVVDIGGHIGTFTVMSALNGANVAVFEPTNENYAMLEKNIAQNGVQSVVRAFNSAVVGDKREFRIRFSPQNAGSSQESKDGYDVATITFDEVMDLFDHVHVLKMDCEGTEHEFPIEKYAHKIDTIVAEVHYGRKLLDRIEPFYDVTITPSKASRCFMITAHRKC